MGRRIIPRAPGEAPDEPVIRIADPEDREAREEAIESSEDIGECSDLEESREAADIPRTRSEERGIIFENVPVSDLFSFLEEDEPKFINYNNKKVLAVLVSKIISPILEPLSDSILAEAEDELLEKASELLAPELQSANISVEESLNEIALFENFESLDLSKQACSIKQHGYKIIFAIKEEDFIFNSELPSSPESVENPGELDDPGDFAPEPELINSYPTANSLVICDYDTFRSKMKTISRFFRFYGLILKNPKKGYFVSGVSYSSHSFRLRNKGKNIRFVDQFKNVLKNHGRQRENPNKNYYIPSFNNNKKITIFFNSNFTSINAIKFTREEGCEKVEEFLEINKAELERGALTNSNTNWFIKTHERAYPFVANYLFSSASREKMDPLDAVQKYFLPPGAKLRQKKCYEDFDFKDLPGMMADGFTELALENGARDLFENKPLKTFEDILREQSLLNSPEFNKFRLAISEKGRDNKMLQDLFFDAIGGRGAFKAGGQEIREDFRAFKEGFDPKIFAYLAIGTLASQAINGLIDTDTLNAFVAKRLGELLGDKISFRRILRSVPMPVLMNIIGSAGLFSPSLLAAMNSNVSDLEAVVRDPEGAGSIPLKFQLEEELRQARQKLLEINERTRDLPRNEYNAGLFNTQDTLSADIVALETSLQDLENNGRRTPEEAFDAIGRDGSKFRKELELAGFTQSDFNKVIELATENADENLSQIQALLIELVLMAYECGSSGVNKQIGFMISQEIIKFVGLDEILEQFDDFADFLTAWDISNMDFCNPPTWPPPGFDFDFSLNIKFPRFDLGGLLAFIFPLLLLAIIGLIVGLIMMIIRIILSLIPNIPLNLEICEVANYLRDVGVDLSDAICKRMKGTHSLENKLARRTGALVASTFSSKNSVCNFLGLGDEALETNPDKSNEIAGCIEDFCSLLTPNTSFKFMRGNLDESEARLLLRVLRNSGKDNCKEFAESMENMPNFVQVVNDLGFVIGEAVDIDGFADDMFPFDPEAPMPSLGRQPIQDICELPGTPLTAECYGNISDERLAQIIQNNRERNNRLVSDAVGILTGGTTFDELFRNNAPPPLHPSDMLDDEGLSQATFQNGSAPIVSRDEGPLKGIRRDSFAALFGAMSVNFDGDIRVLTENATRSVADIVATRGDVPPDPRLDNLAPQAPEEISLVVDAEESETGFLFEIGRYPENIQIKTSMETLSTDEVRNKIFMRNEVRNNAGPPLGLSFDVDYDLPTYSIPIREWMQENSNTNRLVNQKMLQAIIEDSLSTTTTDFFNSYLEIPFINNSLNFAVGEYSKNIVKIFSEQVNNLIPLSETSSLEELESFEINSLRPAGTKLCINNPLYSILTLEDNYFNGFLNEIKTMERFEKCSRKYSKILSRFRDDEVATLDGALRGNIDTQILNSYFEQFYSLYTFGEVMPSLFNRPAVFSSFIQQRTLNKIGIDNYPKFALLCQELQRIRGVDLDELRSTPGALEQFIQESRQIAEALVDNVRAAEIIQKREELNFKKYFDNNILSFKKSFKNFFKVNGKVVDTSEIERKENDELFSTITLDNFTNVEYCEQPRHSITDLVFSPTSRSEEINGFIRPFYYPSIKLGNYENNAIFLERFFYSNILFSNSFIKIGDDLDISSFPAETGDLRYSILSRLKFKEDFLSSEAETEYFSNIIIEEFTELVEPPEAFAARLDKLSNGEKIEIPFEEILTLGSDIDMINSNNFIFKIYNALSEEQRERFDIVSRNDILKIIDVELGMKIYLINHSSDITEEFSFDIDDDQKLFTKAADSKTSFTKLLWEDAGGLGREFPETQKIIKLLELGESFASIEEISFPTGDIDTSISTTDVKILPFRLGNMYANADVVDSSTEGYLEEFYGLNNLIPSLISNSEIEDLLTYPIPVDIILGGLSIYYSDFLKIWEEVLGLNYFRRGFKEYEKINKSFFEVMINILKRKKIKFSLRDLAAISPIL